MSRHNATSPFEHMNLKEEVPAQVDPDRSSRNAFMLGVSQLPLEPGALHNLSSYIQEAQVQLNKQGEEPIRLHASRVRKSEQVDALLGLADEEEPHYAISELLDTPDSVGADYALEEQAANAITMAAQLDPSNPHASQEDDYDFFDARRDRTAKQLIWQRYVDEVMQEREERPWGYGFLEMVGLSGIPLYNSMTQTGLFEEYGLTQSWFDNILSGSAVREESALFHEVMDEMTVEEFNEFAPVFVQALRERVTHMGGSITNLSFMHQLMTELVDAPTVAQTTVFNAVDNVPLVGVAGRGVRMTGTGVRYLAAAGSRRTARDAVANAVEIASREGVEIGAQAINGSPEDLLGGVSSSSVNPFGGLVSPSMSEDIFEGLRAAQRMLDEAMDAMGGATPTSRLNPDEAVEARAAAEAHLLERTNREVADVAFETVELPGGSYTENAVAIFGTQTGDGGYRSASSARRAAQRRGFEGDVFEGTDGSWYWKASVPVSEQGFFSTNLEHSVSNMFSRWLLGGSATSDRGLFGAAVAAEGTTANFQRGLIRGVQRQVRGFSKGERRRVSEVWQLGNNQSVWFDEGQFAQEYARLNNGAHPPAKAWQTYQLMRRVNDIDYLLRSDGLYRELQTEGYESFRLTGEVVEELNGEDLIGRALRPDERPSGRVWDVNESRMVDAPSEVPSGYRVVRLNEARRVGPEGSEYMVQDLLVPDSGALFRPLRRDVLPYRRGGHRMPQGNFFVKQARRFTDADGQHFLVNPRTYIAARNRGEARAWANTMEEVRGILQRAGDEWDTQEVFDQIDGLVGSNPGYDSAESIMAQMRRGEFNTEDAFRPVADRDLPDEYLVKSGAINVSDEVSNMDLMVSRTSGRMYTGRRGEEVLPDWKGDNAPTLDMLAVAQRSLANVGNVMALTDYKLEALRRFRQTYGKHFEPGASNNDLLTAQVTAPAEIQRGLEANRAQINRILNTPTRHEQWQARAQREFSAWVAGDNPDGWRYRTTNQVADWLSEKDGVQALRTAAFDLKLGMFNIAQLPLQLSTSIAAISLDPVNGVQALPSAMFARLAMWNPNMVEGMVKNGVHDILGMSADEMRNYMLSVRRSGFFKLGGNHALLDEGGASAINLTGGKFHDLHEASRWFFYNAESLNRLVGGHIAWKEVRRQFPDLATDSAAFQSRWLTRADDYSFSMSNASRAPWQRGILSVPTQFWSYSARMMEAMVGKKFTTAQKIRLVLGQGLLWGSGGVPLAGLPLWVADQFAGEDEKAAALNTLRGFYERGGMDHIVNWTTGADVLVGERIGAGQLPARIVEDLFNSGDYGDTSAASLVGGATWSIWGDILGDMHEVARWGAREMGHGDMPNTRDSVMRLARNASTFSNATKAWMLHQYNVYISAGDTRLAYDMPDASAFAALLSYRPGGVRDIVQAEEYLAEGGQAERDLRDAITRTRQRMYENPERADELSEDLANTMMLFPLDVRVRARAAAGRGGPLEALLDRLTQQVERRSYERRIAEAIEEND